MRRTFLRSHVFAWLAAAPFAFLGAFALTAAPPNLLRLHPGLWLEMIFLPSVVAILFTWILAFYLGRYDRLVILPGAAALALAFAVSYSSDLCNFLPDDGHTLFDVLTYGARPFDLPAQLWIFAGMALWCGAMVESGIALKRFWHWRGDPLENRIARPWLALDLVLIFITTAGILFVKTRSRLAEESLPRAKPTLSATASTPAPS